MLSVGIRICVVSDKDTRKLDGTAISLLNFDVSNDEPRVAIYHGVKSPHNLPQLALSSYESQSESNLAKMQRRFESLSLVGA
jgi:hypothetical protein